jgi:hypothetical protein
MDAAPFPASPHPAGQAKNEQVRKLAIHLTGVDNLRLAVLLTPLRDGAALSKDHLGIAPLKEW